LLRPLQVAERRQLIDLLTRVADHLEELSLDATAAEAPRPAQALRALGTLADTADPDRARHPVRKRPSRPR
jgi:hypothetical protein